MDLRINDTRQTGAVENRTYREDWMWCDWKPHLPGSKSVYLFFEFTINDPIAKSSRIENMPELLLWLSEPIFLVNV